MGFNSAFKVLIMYANIHTHSHSLYVDGNKGCIYARAKS